QVIGGDCPSQEQLRALLSGDETFAQHVEQCEACQQALERLAGDVRPALVEEPELRKVIVDLVADERPDEEGERLDFLMPSDLPGYKGRIGQYYVIELVGRGGMGVVLKAHDPQLGRIVAVKVLNPVLAAGTPARRRFVREARAAAAVSHEHVVTIHAV